MGTKLVRYFVHNVPIIWKYIRKKKKQLTQKIVDKAKV